jgi:hypothetical protein
MTDLEPLNPAAARLAKARQRLLPQNSAIIGVRYSALDVNLVSTGRSRTYDTVYPGTAALENDVPQAAIKVTLRANPPDPNRKEMTLRMIPDARVIKGEYNPSATFDQALQGFIQAACADFKFRGLDNLAGDFRIKGISSTGKLDFDGVVPFPSDTLVQTYRLKPQDSNIRIPTGQFKLVETSTGSSAGWYLQGWVCAVPILVKSGYLRRVRYKLLTPVYDAEEAANPMVVVKKVGRGLFQYAGRRARRTR